MNVSHERVYNYLLGDKDTYWIAMVLCGEEWYCTGQAPGSLSIRGCDGYGSGWRCHVQQVDNVLTHINESDWLAYAYKQLYKSGQDASTLIPNIVEGYVRTSQKPVYRMVPPFRTYDTMNIPCDTQPWSKEDVVIPFTSKESKHIVDHLSTVIAFSRENEFTSLETFDI